MNDVIDYTVPNPSNNVVDMFDQDNFYPFDGEMDEFYDNFQNYSGLDADGEGLDIEYSEALGGWLKNVATKAKTALQNRRSMSEDDKTQALGYKLGKRQSRLKGRMDRRKMRQEARQTRRNMRQIKLVKEQTPEVKQKIADIVTLSIPENPTIKEAVDKTAEGLATPKQEQTTQTVVEEAKKAVIENKTDLPIIADDKGKTEVKDSWWKKLPLGGKIGIIAGGVLVLGLGTWGVIKISK